MISQEQFDRFIEMVRTREIDSPVSIKIFSQLICLQVNIQGAQSMAIDDALTKIYNDDEITPENDRLFDDAIDELIDLQLLNRSPILGTFEDGSFASSHTYSFGETSCAE